MKNELLKRILSSVILLPVVIFIIIEGSLLFNFFIIICFLITLYEWHMMSKKKPYYLLGFIFLILSFYTIHKLIDFGDSYIIFLFITLICVFTDLGGYIFGKIFKGPKLTKLSPKKTYAGMIGGFLLPIIFTNFFFDITHLFKNKLEISLNLLIFIFLVSLVSQLGDIFISYFKRLSKIKDTGKLIPGHGGILDRIDGMIFSFPFSYLILSSNILNIFK